MIRLLQLLLWSRFRLSTLACCLLCSNVFAAKNIPYDWLGEWAVVQVAVDLADQPHWRYEPDDPRLMGRILKIGLNGYVSFNFGREDCNQLKWLEDSPSTLQLLIRRGFSIPSLSGSARNVLLRDFNLGISDRKFMVFRVLCSDEGNARNGKHYWADGWFVGINKNMLLIAYGGDTILRLVRQQAEQPYLATNSCDNPKNITEQVICNSLPLAGFDRSVKMAFHRSLKRRSQEQTLLQTEQNEWIKQRNQCQVDISCLEESMRDRIDMLMQD